MGHEKPLLYIVDDEPMLLELAVALLEPSGFETATFRDAESAYDAFAAASPRPHIVITDYAMGSMNGLELIEACRRLEPLQKAFLVSGTVQDDIFRNSRSRPDEFMAKPFHPAQFIEKVEELFRRQPTGGFSA